MKILSNTPESFRSFEEGIRESARRNAELPGQEIVLIRLYGHLGKALMEDVNRVLAPFELTLPRWQILIWLHTHPGHPVNPSQICDLITESPTGITRLTDELVSRGWIERHPSSEDRRRVELGITPAGAALVEKAQTLVWNHLRKIYGVLNKTEMRTLEALMKKLLVSVEGLAERSGGAE